MTRSSLVGPHGPPLDLLLALKAEAWRLSPQHLYRTPDRGDRCPEFRERAIKVTDYCYVLAQVWCVRFVVATPPLQWQSVEVITD